MPKVKAKVQVAILPDGEWVAFKEAGTAVLEWVEKNKGTWLLEHGATADKLRAKVKTLRKNKDR